MFAAIRPTVTRGNVRVGTLSLIGSTSAPPSNACRPLARDHAAPGTTLALAKATSLGRGRVRPLAWCSRPSDSAASLGGALALVVSRRRGQLGVVVLAGERVLELAHAL